MSTVVGIENLRKSFGALEVIKGIDLTIAKGETVVLLGASGSGKSTILRCVNFLEMPTSGKISFNGKALGTAIGGDDTRRAYKAAELRSLRARIGIVFQQFNLFPHMTVLENITESQCSVLKRSKAEAVDRAQALLKRIGLEEKARSYPGSLSGGQQQRVAICRALAMDPEVMLFDEATSALDPELVGEVLSTMRELSEEGMTMLIVTHELGFAYHVSDRVVFLNNGLILEQGTAEEVIMNPQQESTRQFINSHVQFRLPNASHVGAAPQ
jgi:polar amino acid transport system ATP-binding protein